MNQKTLDEQLLAAWVRLTGVIKNSRITKGLAYNEAIIMLLLYNRFLKDGDGLVSIKEITRETKMLKSLVNRTINTLEEKGLLERRQIPGDKRMVYVRCIKEKLNVFLAVHNTSLHLAQNLIDIIGEEDARAFVRISKKICDSDYQL